MVCDDGDSLLDVLLFPLQLVVVVGLSVGFVFLTFDALELLARWASGNSPTRQNILKNKI